MPTIVRSRERRAGHGHQQSHTACRPTPFCGRSTSSRRSEARRTFEVAHGSASRVVRDRPGQPAFLHAVLKALINDTIRRGVFSPRRSSATMRKNSRFNLQPSLVSSHTGRSYGGAHAVRGPLRRWSCPLRRRPDSWTGASACSDPPSCNWHRNGAGRGLGRHWPLSVSEHRPIRLSNRRGA